MGEINDNQKINSPDKEFILDILNFHNSVKDKTANMDYITVCEHPDFKSSRCFFIVNKDGSKIVIIKRIKQI